MFLILIEVRALRNRMIECLFFMTLYAVCCDGIVRGGVVCFKPFKFFNGRTCFDVFLFADFNLQLTFGLGRIFIKRGVFFFR